MAWTCMAWATRWVGILDGAEEIQSAIGSGWGEAHVETHCVG